MTGDDETDNYGSIFLDEAEQKYQNITSNVNDILDSRANNQNTSTTNDSNKNTKSTEDKASLPPSEQLQERWVIKNNNVETNSIGVNTNITGMDRDLPRNMLSLPEAARTPFPHHETSCASTIFHVVESDEDEDMDDQ